jgi:hypothetical protein
MSTALLKLMNQEAWEWPEGAGDTLLSSLKDATLPEEQRLAATEMAGETVVVNDEIGCELLRMIGDASLSEEVRSQAAISLGPALEDCDLADWEEDDEFGSETLSQEVFGEVQTALQALFARQDVPDHVRRCVLEASVRAENSWHEAAVRSAWADKDKAWRITGVFCMQYVTGFDKEILEAVHSSDEDLQMHGIVAAGERGVLEAWATVERLLARPPSNKSLLIAAILAVPGIRPDEVDLVSKFLDHEDEDVAEAASEATFMSRPEEGDFDDDIDLGSLRDDLEKGQTMSPKMPMLIPDQHECNDPTHHHHQQEQAVSNKVGRNEPCPCGSGKKHKKCCGA